MIGSLFLLLASTSWAIQPVPIRPTQRAPQGYEAWAEEFSRRIQANFMQYGSAIRAVDLRNGGTVHGIIYVPTIVGPLTVAGSSLSVTGNAYVSGNLGIGTASPGQKLTVDKAGGASDTISVANAFMYIKDSTLDAGLAFQSKLSAPYAQTISGFDSANNLMPLLLNPNGGNVTIGSGGTPLINISTRATVPTANTLTNLDAVTFIVLSCSRAGPIVDCFGEVNIDPTGAGGALFRMPIPISSDFTVQEDCGGVFSDNGTSGSGRIYGRAASDECVFEFQAADGSSRGFNFKLGFNIK